MLQWVLRLAGRLPLSWLHGAGAALGWIVYWSSPGYAGRLAENLQGSGVCAGADECGALRRAAIAEAGKAVAELPAVWFGAAEAVARLVVECAGWDVAERALARGAGVIFLTPHLGCFEISALYAAQRMPLTV